MLSSESASRFSASNTEQEPSKTGRLRHSTSFCVLPVVQQSAPKQTAPKSADDSKKQRTNDQKENSVRDAARIIVQSVMEAGSKSIDVWDAALSHESATPQLVAEIVYQLNAKGQHALAVEGLESAIRNDCIDPWMYDVLAFEMKLAGRLRKTSLECLSREETLRRPTFRSF